MMEEPEDKWFIVTQAANHGIALHSRDIEGSMGHFTIDRMPWREWLDNMTD
jgi:hypothetical protein